MTRACRKLLEWSQSDIRSEARQAVLDGIAPFAVPPTVTSVCFAKERFGIKLLWL